LQTSTETKQDVDILRLHKTPEQERSDIIDGCYTVKTITIPAEYVTTSSSSISNVPANNFEIRSLIVE
jgi:hypothetical protein